MIMAVFCLLSAVGAWMTWRHNPLYSLKSTLRILGTLLLLVATCVGLILLAIRLSDGRSVAVQGAAMATAVILSALGMIFGLTAASTPAEARLQTRLPPHVALVTLNRQRIRPWWRVAAYFLGGTLLFALIPGPVRIIALTFAGMGAGLGLIMFPTAYFMALRMDRSVTALQLHPWLHWHYMPEVWADWGTRQAERQAQAEAEKMTPVARRRTLIILTGIATLYAAVIVPGSALVRIGAAALGGLFMLGIGLWTCPQPQHAAQKIARKLKAAPPDTYFGHDGVLCNGEFFTWLTPNVYLMSASLLPGPPKCIELRFEQIAGGTQIVHVYQQVLLPPDAATTDLPVLQAALAARCPNVRIKLA